MENSPHIDVQSPISRQHEMTYLGYYGYPHYWGGAGVWGQGAYPGIMMPGLGYEETASEILQVQTMAFRKAAEADADSRRGADAHLRSRAAVPAYQIGGNDGDIGHLADFLIDDDSWSIRYLIGNTGNWWPGHQVLISPEWITDVNWAAVTLSIDLARDRIRSAPAYDSLSMPDRAGEIDLYRHYGRSDNDPRGSYAQQSFPGMQE